MGVADDLTTTRSATVQYGESLKPVWAGGRPGWVPVEPPLLEVWSPTIAATSGRQAVSSKRHQVNDSGRQEGHGEVLLAAPESIHDPRTSRNLTGSALHRSTDGPRWFQHVGPGRLHFSTPRTGWNQDPSGGFVGRVPRLNVSILRVVNLPLPTVNESNPDFHHGRRGIRRAIGYKTRGQ